MSRGCIKICFRHNPWKDGVFLALLCMVVLLARPLFAQQDNSLNPLQQITSDEYENLPEDAKKILQKNRSLLRTPSGMEEEQFRRKILESSPEKAGVSPEIEKEKENKYRWQDSIYVRNLFGPRLKDLERKSLVHFGHDIFDREKGKFAPLTTLPVSPDYIVGPGDEMLITFWGRMEGRYPRTIDREGKIFIPKFGTLYVAGKTYREVKEFISKRVGVVTGANVDVSVTRLKGIKVFILGEVNRPGAYNVSSFQTAIQALYTGGGIKDTGSLRSIRILRNGKVVSRIDLYKLLLEGNASGDIQLLQGDTVFVPVVKRLVALSGEVRRQAIFELTEKETLKSLVRMAGGFSPAAYMKKIQIERLEKNRSMIVHDLNGEDLMRSKKDFPLKDGDIIRVEPLFLEDTHAITLQGNVTNPGKYELKKEMKIRDLLPDQSSFLHDTYFDYATLIRLIPPDMHKMIVSLNLRKAVLEKDEGANIVLKPLDTLIVYSKIDFEDLPLATISGPVRDPGSFEVQEGMRVSDLIRLSGNLEKIAYLEKGEVVRVKKDHTLKSLYFNVEKAMKNDPENNILLEDEDHVIIRSHPKSRERIFAKVKGEVKFPGYYAVEKGGSLSSVIEKAGGYKEDAYLKGAVFTRESVRKVQQERINQLIQNLEHKIASQTSEELVGIIDPEDVKVQKDLLRARQSLLTKLRSVRAKGRIVIHLQDQKHLKGAMSDLVLEDNDTLTIPKFMNVVNVIGAVYNPTAVTYDQEEKEAGYYLDIVGGPTDSADEKEIFIIKADGSVLSKKNVESIRSANLDPGDTIAVPEKIEKTRAIKDVKDVTQIMFQIAVTAGVIIAAF